MAHELEVRLFANRVGTLALVDGRLSFCYASVWLSQSDAVVLSISLPLQAQPFDDHQTRPFFAGLLPVGQMRRLIAQQFQVSRQNDFALLDHIGGDCAGAVTFVESGLTLSAPGDGDDVQWLSDEDVVAIQDELPLRPMLAGKDGLRLSLAGAQDKLPVVFAGARMGLPLTGTPRPSAAGRGHSGCRLPSASKPTLMNQTLLDGIDVCLPIPQCHRAGMD